MAKKTAPAGAKSGTGSEIVAGRKRRKTPGKAATVHAEGGRVRTAVSAGFRIEIDGVDAGQLLKKP